MSTGRTIISFEVISKVGLPWWLSGKESPAMQDTPGRSLSREDPLEESMATHSSVLAWRIPWTAPLRVSTSRTTGAEHP